MPQFDLFSYSSQLFWLFLLLTFLYLYFNYILLPSIAVVLKVRKFILNSSKFDIVTPPSQSLFILTSSYLTSSNSSDVEKRSSYEWCLVKMILNINISYFFELSFYFEIVKFILFK